jgi:HKD family nuclease/Zn finger protein HypA/HybF involved in hydrogenase expression
MQTLFLESGQVSYNIRRLLESESIDEINFAVAYLTDAGYLGIEKSLKRFLRRKGQIKFLVGMSGVYVTESRALNRLLKLVKRQKGKNLEVKYHNPQRGEFHPKLILAKCKRRLKEVIAGSSNLTSGGQKGNIEANVLVTIGKSSNGNTKEFVRDANEFFQYIWRSGEILDSTAIRKYAKGEKKKTAFTEKHIGLPRTKLPPFVYMNGKRKVMNSLEILCTDCNKNYVKVPLNAFYCDECSNDFSVIIPSPNRREIEEKKRLKKIVARADDRKIRISELGFRCPSCNTPIDATDEFMLWIICDECAKKRRQGNKYICKPFSRWNDKVAKNLYYGLNQKRVKYSN